MDYHSSRGVRVGGKPKIESLSFIGGVRVSVDLRPNCCITDFLYRRIRPYLNPRPARKPYGIKTSHLEKPGGEKNASAAR
jgi:hypothetical protein